MRLQVGLILAVVLGLSPEPALAGGGVWMGRVTGANIGLIDFHDPDQTIIRQAVSSNVEVAITYNPASFPGLTGVTIGDTTTYTDYDPRLFSLSIDCGPGFVSTMPISITVTAPPDGVGLDTIAFSAMGVPEGYNSTMRGPGMPGNALVTLYAPSGTLATSAELPPSLDAFAAYAAVQPGGWWSFAPGEGYLGGAAGTLGAVPEPAALTSIATGMTFALACLALRRLRRGR
jgi:hypothetical protein